MGNHKRTNTAYRRLTGRSLVVAVFVLAITCRDVLAADVGDLFEDPELRSSAQTFSQWLKTPFLPSEEEPLATDRPDFTEASSAVGRGRVQLESGYTFVRDRTADTKTTAHAVPQFVWRIGVTKMVELRIVWDAGYLTVREVDRTTGAVTRREGSTDILLGTKVQFTEQEGWIPESALIATLSVPSGSQHFRAATTEPRFNLLYGWDLSEKLNFAGSTGLGFIAEQSDHYTAAHQSLTVNYGFTEKLGMYHEWFALFSDGAEDNTPEHYYDFGFTYKFTPNFQIDWRIGFGLNERADDLFTGVGYGIRW